MCGIKWLMIQVADPIFIGINSLALLLYAFIANKKNPPTREPKPTSIHQIVRKKQNYPKNFLASPPNSQATLRFL